MTANTKLLEASQSGYNRREFLTYSWGIAAALVLVEAGFVTYQFLYPRFRRAILEVSS